MNQGWRPDNLSMSALARVPPVTRPHHNRGLASEEVLGSGTEDNWPDVRLDRSRAGGRGLRGQSATPEWPMRRGGVQSPSAWPHFRASSASFAVEGQSQSSDCYQCFEHLNMLSDHRPLRGRAAAARSPRRRCRPGHHTPASHSCPPRVGTGHHGPVTPTIIPVNWPISPNNAECVDTWLADPRRN